MNDDGKSYLKQLKDIRFIMFDICRCTIEGLPKAFDEIKESLERLEKLENIIDILKDEAYITIETDIDETGTEFHATLREKGGNGEIFIDEVNREECYLLEEVFGQ